MNHASKTLFAGAGLLAVICAPTTAAAFMDDFFAAPQSSWSNDPQNFFPYAPFQDGMRGATDPRRQMWRRRAHASPRKRESRPRHVAIRISHPAPKEIDPKIQAYLTVPAFTQRFSETPASGAPDGASEAIAYLLQNDPTLRPGDAVVTRAGFSFSAAGITSTNSSPSPTAICGAASRRACWPSSRRVRGRANANTGAQPRPSLSCRGLIPLLDSSASGTATDASSGLWVGRWSAHERESRCGGAPPRSARALAPRTQTKASASRMNTRVWFSRCDKTRR